ALPEQQAHLLTLAQRQGILYSHQLPSAANGLPRDEIRRFLGRVGNDPFENLAPVRAAALDAPDLHPAQREAVAKALATPDICLIQGWRVTGKSRVAAEIVARSAERGERVLLVAPQAASVDRVLEQLQGEEFACPARYLAPDENHAELPETSRTLVFSERVR